jgi:polar amino acid transport system permease protein
MAVGAKIGRLFALTALGLLLAGCAGSGAGDAGAASYSWGWYIFNPFQDKGLSNLQFLLGGMWWTILVSVSAIALSVVLGALVAVAGLSGRGWLNRVNRVYVDLFRAIPLLVLMLWVFYGLPVIIGLQLGVFATGVLSLVISDSAFEAEVFRAGIQSLPRGRSRPPGAWA